MARACGLSVSTVQRIWRAFGLQPHRLETFKLSTDPDFVAKVRDIVGLYVAPPERAIVLCVDEKSQIQALDRSQPILPMRPGQAERAVATTTSAMAPPRCLPPLTCNRPGDRQVLTAAIAPQSSASFSMRSKPLFQTSSTSISSWTITQPTRRR